MLWKSEIFGPLVHHEAMRLLVLLDVEKSMETWKRRLRKEEKKQRERLAFSHIFHLFSVAFEEDTGRKKTPLKPDRGCSSVNMQVLYI